jgi:hypothetical protein
MVLLAGRVVYFGDTRHAMIDYFVSQCGARQPTVGDNLVEWLMVSSLDARMPGPGPGARPGAARPSAAAATMRPQPQLAAPALAPPTLTSTTPPPSSPSAPGARP